MEHHFECCDQSIRSAAVDELSSASGHGLSFGRIHQQVLNRLPKHGGIHSFMPAKANGGAFIFEPLGRRPMQLGLNYDELRHTHTSEFQRKRAATRDSYMATS